MSKKYITEKEVTKAYFPAVAVTVNKEWPRIYNSLREHWPDIYFKDEFYGKTYFSIAVMAMEIETLTNLFPEHASSLIHKILEPSHSKSPESQFLVSNLNTYREKVQESINNRVLQQSGVPLEGVIIQLLGDWFGEDVSKYYVDKYKIVDPMLVQALSIDLLSLIGYWKMVKENYVIEG